MGKGPGPKAKRPEGEGWLTTQETARILGVAVKTVRNMANAGRIERTRTGLYNWYRVETVEAIARNPDRLRVAANHTKRIAGRKVASLEGSSMVRINGREARLRLGVSVSGLLTLVDSAKLTLYKEAGSRKNGYSRAEVEELRAARARQGVKEAREAQWERPQEQPDEGESGTGQRKPTGGGRIGPGDLGEFERYFGEWLTVRQVAFLLNTSEGTVRTRRKQGQLQGEWRAAGDGIYGRRQQWLFRKRDVDALLEDRRYFKRRMAWEQHNSLAARKRKQAEAARANTRACAEATKRHIESGSSGCIRWLDAKW